MENYICFKCGKLCPYDNMIPGLPSGVAIILTEHYPPCKNHNKDFFGIKNRHHYSYFNNMEVACLADAIEFVINDKNTSLEDTLKLTKIKSRLQ